MRHLICRGWKELGVRDGLTVEEGLNPERYDAQVAKTEVVPLDVPESEMGRVMW